MWLLVYAPAILGVLRYRRWSYWRWVVAMLLWQAAAQFLFASGGTLDHPTGDGLISRAIRQATDDGPATATRSNQISPQRRRISSVAFWICLAQ